MYTQFFGNFLLNNKVVNPDQLLDLMTAQQKAHIKLGTLAIHEGYMTADEVDSIIIMQTHEDKMFGELAVEMGYLTPGQLETLVGKQIPDYLLLGQLLVEKGYCTNAEFENLLLKYQSENELASLEQRNADRNNVFKIIMNYCGSAKDPMSESTTGFLNLFFNNLIRFIGDDFTVLSLQKIDSVEGRHIVSQEITGYAHYLLMLELEERTALDFANRYAKEDFSQYGEDAEEFISASLEDFLNLHNGLYLVNLGPHSEGLSLQPPYTKHDENLSMGEGTYMLPIMYPFGTVHLIFRAEETADK